VADGAAFAAAAAAYPFVVETGWLETTVTGITLPGRSLPGTLRLLHLSDLHCSSGRDLALVREAIDLGLAGKPHLICLTGDYVTAGRSQPSDEYAAVLRRLPEAAPCYAVLGNHDGGIWTRARGYARNTAEIIRFVEQAGIQVLHNQAAEVEIEGAKVTLAGIGDLWSGEFDAQRAWSQVGPAPDRPVIVLAHNPDSKNHLGRDDWDLMLCGHTHGGQVVLPLIGAPYIPVRDRRFIAGLVAWRGRQVYVTRGVGSILGMRFNCRPEVSILRISGAE